jgi:hypothetical protein
MKPTVDTDRHTPNADANHRTVEAGARTALPRRPHTLGGGRRPCRPSTISHCGQCDGVVQSLLTGSVAMNAPVMVGSPHSPPVPAMPAVHTAGRCT